MAWSGGTFTRIDGPTGWQDDAGAGIPIQASLHDTAFNDLATDGINQCLNKAGQNSPTANLPMAGFKHTNCANGSADSDYSTIGQIKAGVTFNSSAKIKGDFSNATATSRTALQTSTTNGNTIVEVITDGTGSTSQITLNGGSDAANSSTLQLTMAGATEARINASARGTGSFTPMVFFTSNTERMRIATDGRVALGAPATARAQLHLNGAGQTTAALTDAGNRGGTLRLIDSNGSAGNGGAITFGTNNADTADSVGFAAIKGLLTAGGTNTTGHLAFATRNAIGDIALTERMRLNDSGTLSINDTTANAAQLLATTLSNTLPAFMAKSNVATDLAQPTFVVQKNDNNNTTSQILVRFSMNGGATGLGQINGNGASQAAFGSFSDQRLKENIVNLPSQTAALMALRPVEFDYKDGSGHQIGFIAQEVQQIYPDLVGESGDGFLTLSGMGKNEARLVKGFQELASEIQTLKARVEALEAGNP